MMKTLTLHPPDGPLGSRTIGSLPHQTNVCKLGFFCSTKCPGGLIFKIYDFARSVREAGLTIIGGFHTPVEKDCLYILLRGSGLIIQCPARRLSASRLPHEWRKAIAGRRMLLLSPLDESQNRATAELAVERNRFVVSVADEVLIAYAHNGSKTEGLCGEVLATNKRVYTFNDPANRHLVEMGAIPSNLIISPIGKLISWSFAHDDCHCVERPTSSGSTLAG